MKTHRLHRSRSLAELVADARALIHEQFVSLLQEHPHLLHLALNEAEALAWQSGVPHLVFPLLAQEKVEAVARWNRRQNELRQPSFVLALAE